MNNSGEDLYQNMWAKYGCVSSLRLLDVWVCAEEDYVWNRVSDNPDSVSGFNHLQTTLDIRVFLKSFWHIN